MFRLARYYTKKYPLIFLVVAAGVVYALHEVLSLFVWGRHVIDIVSLMISVEYGASRLYHDGASFWKIVGMMILSHCMNVALDLFVVRYLLMSRKFRRAVDTFSRLGKTFIRQLKKIFFNGTPNDIQSEEPGNFIVRFQNHLNGFKKNPTKAGLLTIYVLCLIPRIPPLPGGIGISVFIIRYNRMGWRGWTVLFLGIASHLTYVLGTIYGVSSLYRMLFL